MAITERYIVGSDNITHGSEFEPHRHTATLFIEECSETVEEGGDPWTRDLTTAQDVLTYLQSDSGSWRAMVGYELEYAGTGSAWISLIPHTEFGKWRVRNIDIKERRDKQYAWDVVITSTNMGFMPDTKADQTSSFNGFGLPDISVNTVTRPRNTNAWRAGELTIPADTLGPATTNDPTLFSWCHDDWQLCNTAQDAGGIPIDINGGQPTQTTTNSEQITIEYVVRADWQDWGPVWETDENYNYLPTLQKAVNARNAENLFGYAPGYLLLTDVAIQPLHHEFKRVVLTLQYDAWKHAVQRPWITSGGVVRGQNSCEGGEVPDGYTALVNLTALQVWWVQPYLSAFSLGATPQFPIGVWDTAWRRLYGDDPDYTPASAGSC